MRRPVPKPDQLSRLEPRQGSVDRLHGNPPSRPLLDVAMDFRPERVIPKSLDRRKDEQLQLAQGFYICHSTLQDYRFKATTIRNGRKFGWSEYRSLRDF